MTHPLRKIINSFGWDFHKKRYLEDVFYIKKKLLQRQQYPIIFDIGAYHGEFALKYSQIFPSAKIFAFEPTLATFNRLKKNTSGQKNISIYNQAFSDTIGKVSFQLNNAPSTNSLLKTAVTDTFIDKLGQTKDTIEIDATLIDMFTEENELDKIDLIKLDVQGASLKVLNGAMELLKKKKIEIIYTEIEFLPAYQDQPLFDDIWDFHRSLGYKLYGIYNLQFNSNGRILYGDALFVVPELIETFKNEDFRRL